MVRARCRCVSLRTGSLAIGSLYLVLSVAALYLEYSLSTIIRYDYTPNPSPKVITYLICSIILSVILITGAIAKNSKIITVYLFGGLINLPFIIYICIRILIWIYTSVPMSGLKLKGFFIPIIVLILYGRFWLVVYSYYRELTKKPDNEEAVIEM